MRKPLTICVALAIAAALTASSAAGKSASRTVEVGDNWFVRDSDAVPKITVKPNTTVRFKFVGEDAHNVWGYRGGTRKFKSSIRTEGVYERQLRVTGTYKVVCNIHGADDQSMRIVVKK